MDVYWHNNSLRPRTHICVGKLTIIVSDNGLSSGRRQAIIWTNAGMLFIGPVGTNFNEILIWIHTFSFTKMHLKMSCVKWRLFCLGPNVSNRLYEQHHVSNHRAPGSLYNSSHWLSKQIYQSLIWLALLAICKGNPPTGDMCMPHNASGNRFVCENIVYT